MNPRPLTLTVAALGGQGGGVVLNWMIRVAESAGWLVQATSVPGVAQRTGATIYYLEFHPQPAPGEPEPVMALMPSPGVCDLVIAAELMEAVRMVERGIVDAAVTTLVASSHRAYTIDEKSHPVDGRMADSELVAVARSRARKFHLLDLEAIARRHGSVISAAVLGAIAASEVLPFAVNRFEAAITAEGKGVAASLAAFREAYAVVRSPEAMTGETDARETTGKAIGVDPGDDNDPRLESFPVSLRPLLGDALARLTDYQDAGYAAEYLRRVRPFVDVDPRLAEEVARGLALWMSFEDTIRVADLKTRPDRLLPLMAAGDSAIAHVTDWLKPRPEEIFGTLPKALGAWARSTPWVSRMVRPFTQGQRIRASAPWGYLLFRMLARLKPLRRASLRYAEEWAGIEDWLERVRRHATVNIELAIEMAACQQLVAGYGDTHANGLRRFNALMTLADSIAPHPDAATRFRRLREVALEDVDGRAFDAAKGGIREVEEAA